MRTAEEWYQHLEARPDDWETRWVLADWYEERGDDDLAWAQRWQVIHHKYPHQYTSKVEFPWLWTCVGGLWKGKDHAWLPRAVCLQMKFQEWCVARTMAESERMLALALKACREDGSVSDGSGDDWYWDEVERYDTRKVSGGAEAAGGSVSGER